MLQVKDLMTIWIFNMERGSFALQKPSLQKEAAGIELLEIEKEKILGC